jgi:hypothetical protein
MGRSDVRSSLYMVTISALRFHPADPCDLPRGEAGVIG